MSKAEAKMRGLKRYYTGVPCKYGHIAHRAVNTGNCIACQLIHARRVRDPIKRREYYVRNRERERSTNIAYCASHRARLSKLASERNVRNRDRIAEKSAEWRKANPTYMAAHRRLNKSKYIVYTENRRGRTKGKLSEDIVERLRALQRGKCALCRKALGKSRHIDHIVPLSRGGLNIDSNVQLVHGRCNSKKGRRDQVEFMRSMGMLL